MSIHSSNLEIIKSLNYVPVGLYKNNFSQEWLRDNSGDNISHKNPFYGEYTFHYWLWKNNLAEIESSYNNSLAEIEIINERLNYVNSELTEIEKIIITSFYQTK